MHIRDLAGSARSMRVALVLTASAIFTTGCANLATTAIGGGATGGSSAVIKGYLHGGNQPVSGATLTLNTFGSSLQGSQGTLLATTTSSNDGAGSWSFTSDPVYGDPVPNTGSTFSCPSSGDPYVYVMAKGGNTQGTGSSNNSAAVFVAVLGPCKEISTNAPFTDLTEVGTVATMAALQQYFNPVTESFGANGTGLGARALQNAASLISYMANQATGTAVASKTVSNSAYNTTLNTGSVSITETPESAKINTMANILAACINTATASSTNCTTLFTNATPPVVSATSLPASTTLSQATDVLQALYYMLSNPTNGSAVNLANLYTLPVGAGAPFQPTLSAQPSDWTIGIVYTSSGNCVVTSTSTNLGSFINSPYSLATDAYGSVWFTNAATGNLSELGVPVKFGTPGGPVICGPTNTPLASGTKTSATTLDVSVQPPPINVISNVWGATNGSASLVRYNGPAGSTSIAFPTTEAPLAMTADGLGDVFYSTATGHLYVLTGAATASAAVQDTLISTNLGTPSSLVVDDSNAQPVVWVTTGTNTVARVNKTGLTGQSNELNSYITTFFTTNTPTYGIGVNYVSGALGVNNVFFSVQSASNLLDNIAGSSTSYAEASGWPTASGAGGISLPAGVAVDARSNVWTANNTSGSVSEISAGGAVISPATGFQKSSSYLNSSRAIVIDISGNVWVGGDGNSFLTEIVGAAVPVYQPAAVGLKTGPNGVFQKIP